MDSPVESANDRLVQVVLNNRTVGTNRTDGGVRTFFWTYFGAQTHSGIASTISFNSLMIAG